MDGRFEPEIPRVHPPRHGKGVLQRAFRFAVPVEIDQHRSEPLVRLGELGRSGITRFARGQRFAQVELGDVINSDSRVCVSDRGLEPRR